MRQWLFYILILFPLTAVAQQGFTLVELNCENLFDCRHDTLKQDTEWLPASVRHWTPARFWQKVNSLAQVILSCREEAVPDLVALVEVENDSCLHALTRRSLLRRAGYEYLMTQSPDLRGIDVALLYQPQTFHPLCYEYLEIEPLEGMRPTRDVLYVQGEMVTGRKEKGVQGKTLNRTGESLNRDTLHVFVVHAPSRFGGERQTRPNRRLVANRVIDVARQLPPDARIIIVGDFNDYADSPALQFLYEHGLHNVTAEARGLQSTTGKYDGQHQVTGTYRYQGRWESIDHVLVSASLLDKVSQTYINDAPFLLEPDKKYGGVKPLRTFNGLHYQRGFSDHLPLVVHFAF